MSRVNVRCCGEVIGTLPVPGSRVYEGSTVAFWRDLPWLSRLLAPGKTWSGPFKIPDILTLTVATYTDVTADKFGTRTIDTQITFYADAPELVAKIRKLKSFEPTP